MQFVSEVLPVVTHLMLRLAWSALLMLRARKGGPRMITLKLSRADVAAPAMPAPAAPPEPRTSLCTRCVYAHIVRGYEPGERMVFCGYAYPQRGIPFPVRECTDYRPKRERHGAEEAIGGAVSFPPPEVVAEQFCAVAATRNGEGENESS